MKYFCLLNFILIGNGCRLAFLCILLRAKIKLLRIRIFLPKIKQKNNDLLLIQVSLCAIILIITSFSTTLLFFKLLKYLLIHLKMDSGILDNAISEENSPYLWWYL